MALTDILTPLHGLGGIGSGVGSGIGSGIGSGKGEGVTSQSKITSKSIVVHPDGGGVGGGQDPSLKNSSHKSGHSLTQGDLPNNRQDPSNTVDKHQQVEPVE